MKLTRHKAETLADRLRTYWARKGYEVTVWIEREPWVPGVQEVGWAVRSDLINGLPQKARPALVDDLIRSTR